MHGLLGTEGVVARHRGFPLVGILTALSAVACGDGQTPPGLDDATSASWGPVDDAGTDAAQTAGDGDASTTSDSAGDDDVADASGSDDGDTGDGTDGDAETGGDDPPPVYDCTAQSADYDHELEVGAGGVASIREALDQASANGWSEVKITVEAGHQEGVLAGSLGVFQDALIVSAEPYRARIEEIDLSGGDLAQYVTFEGFDLGGGSGIVVKLDGGQTTDQNIHHVTFRNNVIHDSGFSDVVKVNAGSNHITFERNVIYGHQDDAMDLNSVAHVYVHDNIFFDVTGDRNLLVIKDSTEIGSPDFFHSTQHAYVRRNVFLNWRGGGSSAMLYLGEDNDREDYAVQLAVVESNLFVGNGDVGPGFAAPIALRGVRDVTIRNNTFNGAFAGGRSWAFLAWAITSPQTLLTQDLYIYNNAWVANGGVGTARFSNSDADGIGDFLLDHNLYWNGGQPIPQEDQGLINFTADAAAIMDDPVVPNVPGQIPLPVWDPQSGTFGDGSATICEAFEALVSNYGQPGPRSALVDGGVAVVPAAAGDESPDVPLGSDILGFARTGTPDVGAVERL